MDEDLLRMAEPADYFAGVGTADLPAPLQVLFFLRETKAKLQQNAIQNRSHHRYVLLFNFDTEGHVHVDGEVLPIKPGQALLILPYQFHHFSKLKSKSLRWLFCTFELEEPSLLEQLRNRVLDTNKEVMSLLEQVLQIWHTPSSELQELRLQSGLLSLLLSLRELGEQSSSGLLPESGESLLRSVNRLMDQWRGRTVSIAEVADAMGYSASRLRVIFKQAAGVTLGAYLKNYRLNRAMALLRTSSLSISEIANEAGFASPQAFSRNFKKETGATPRSYRLRT